MMARTKRSRRIYGAGEWGLQHPCKEGRSVPNVQGFCGFFFRAMDPEGLAKWYLDHLGINRAPTNMEMAPCVTESGVTVFSPFDADTDYFAAGKSFMLNFRVADLDAMIAQLTSADIEVNHESEMEGIGRFARIHDPEKKRDRAMGTRDVRFELMLVGATARDPLETLCVSVCETAIPRKRTSIREREGSEQPQTPANCLIRYLSDQYWQLELIFRKSTHPFKGLQK